MPAHAQGPAWSLGTYLAIGLLLRLPAVFFADGFAFVDQQFQYVDPAWHLATGQAWHPTWEWIDGIRSWVYPGFLAGIFHVLRLAGFDEPMWLMRAVRGVDAVLSLLPLWLFWLAVVRWRPIRAPRLPLLLFAGSGLLVTTAVQPSGPAFAATLGVSAVLACHGPRGFPALSGLLLGLAFCCRFQEALFGPPMFAVLWWQRRRGAALWLLLGCLPGLALQGFVDRATWGTFFGSPWGYLQSNLAGGAAAKWQTQPWWFYFVAGAAPVVGLVPPFARVAWQRLMAGAAVLPVALAAAVVHLVAHSCIARKALRFEYGALTLLLAVAAAGLGTAAGGGWAAAWHRRCLLGVHALLFAWASLWFGNAGAVGAANALRESPSFTGDVLVVDGDATSLGGFYYLRCAEDRVRSVARRDLLAHLQQVPPAPGTFVVAVREALAEVDFRGLGRLVLEAAPTGWFDLRRGDRRFVYRWER